jgi:hypothetical protein
MSRPPYRRAFTAGGRYAMADKDELEQIKLDLQALAQTVGKGNAALVRCCRSPPISSAWR